MIHTRAASTFLEGGAPSTKRSSDLITLDVPAKTHSTPNSFPLVWKWQKKERNESAESISSIACTHPPLGQEGEVHAHLANDDDYAAVQDLGELGDLAVTTTQLAQHFRSVSMSSEH